VTLDTYGHLIEGADSAAAKAIEGRTALIRRRGLQLGCNSCFVATGINRNMLVYLTGDVAERLKAAVC
ncbi:MAG: hypothetical protein WA720_17365, partial [Pseudolabrys sp.]